MSCWPRRRAAGSPLETRFGRRRYSPTVSATRDAAATADDDDAVAALRAGDADVFAALVDEHAGAMLRLARTVVGSRAAAEEVVRETWAKALGELDSFDARSSLRTWLFTILLDTARSRAAAEAPFSPRAGLDDRAPPVDQDRFRPAGAQWPGGWKSFPQPVPAGLDTKATRARAREAIESLPDGQRAVLELRDVHAWDATDVCNVLGLSETEQRALLHRARSTVRQALEDFVT